MNSVSVSRIYSLSSKFAYDPSLSTLYHLPIDIVREFLFLTCDAILVRHLLITNQRRCTLIKVITRSRDTYENVIKCLVPLDRRKNIVVYLIGFVDRYMLHNAPLHS